MEEQSDTPETDAAEREDAGPITHAIRGWNYARKHERERDEALDVLRRNGFVLCDIAACNCGSWHARYGIPERMAEIKDALTEAGHPMTNENGHLPIKALAELVKERDEARAEVERLRSAFVHCHVRGSSGDLCAVCGLDLRDKVHTAATEAKP